MYIVINDKSQGSVAQFLR